MTIAAMSIEISKIMNMPSRTILSRLNWIRSLYMPILVAGLPTEISKTMSEPSRTAHLRLNWIPNINGLTLIVGLLTEISKTMSEPSRILVVRLNWIPNTCGLTTIAAISIEISKIMNMPSRTTHAPLNWIRNMYVPIMVVGLPTDLKDYERATQDYTRAIELDPQYVTAYKDRGKAYRNLKDYERANQDCTLAIELDPQDADAYLRRGYIYLWQRDLLQAKADFSQSWRLDSTDVNYGWMIEFVEMCLKKPEIAVAERLEVLAQVDLQSYEASICRGVAQWLQSNYEQALEELEQALSIEPESEDALFWKGIVFASLQEDNSAIAAVEKSLELDLPPVLLAPLHWFEQDRPEFYERYAKPLLARFE